MMQPEEDQAITIIGNMHRKQVKFSHVINEICVQIGNAHAFNRVSQ